MPTGLREPGHCCCQTAQSNQEVPEKTAQEGWDKVERDKKKNDVGNKASCSALHESMLSVICTTYAFKSTSADS